MLNKSLYKRRYLYAVLTAIVLAAASAFILLEAFVLVREEEALMPTASLTFTPVPTPSATPVQKVYTDTQYTDDGIRITVTPVFEEDLAYFVADVQLNSLEYFKTAFANDKFGRNQHEETSSQAARFNAILAINGDYYSQRDTGIVIRGGTLYRDNPKNESISLLYTGELVITDESVSGVELIDQGAIHSWTFGPALVIDGQYVERKSTVNRANPRTGIGMIEPYHYVFIVVDGRGANGSAGLEMKDFAQLFVDLGCQVAYNLDGGGTSTMVMNNKLVNHPCYDDERNISDIIYIGLE